MVLPAMFSPKAQVKDFAALVVLSRAASVDFQECAHTLIQDAVGHGAQTVGKAVKSPYSNTAKREGVVCNQVQKSAGV